MAKGRPAKPAGTRTGHRSDPGLAKAPELMPVAQDLATREPPPGMDGTAADAWRIAVADMAGNRTLRECDLVLLKAWCEAIHVHEEASRNIHDYGVLVRGPKGPIPNPMIRVQKDAAATIRQLSDVLGLNPLARIRGNLLQVAGQSMALGVRDRILEAIAAREAAG